MAKGERQRPRLRQTDSWKAPLCLCPSLSSRPIAEAWQKSCPNPSVGTRFVLGEAADLLKDCPVLELV